VLVRIDPSLYRPLEAENYCADYSKAKMILGSHPRIRFKDLVRIMVEHELGAAPSALPGEVPQVLRYSAVFSSDCISWTPLAPP
jgi:GDPmannose 4,6-dehydratase